MTRLVSITVAVASLRRGAVIGYPTEAVWGLGCDPLDGNAVARILDIKRREAGKGLILAAASTAQLAGLVDWEALAPARRDAVLASWPGPHTWIVPATPRVPRWITGDHDGVAVRVSAHPVVAALCLAFGAPVVSTSANTSGADAPRSLADFDPALLDAVDAVVEGETGGLARATPIRDARTGVALRD